MSSRRGRGRGRGKRKGKNKGKSQSNLLATTSTTTSAEDGKKQSSANTDASKAKQQAQPEIFVGLDVGSSFIKIAAIQSTTNDTLVSLEALQSLFLTESSNASSFHSKINFLADDTGQRCIPSVITILDANHEEILIGSEAAKSSVRNYKNCIYHCKHLTSFTQLNPSNTHNKAIDTALFESQFSQWKKSASKFGMHKCLIRPFFDDDEDEEEEEEDGKNKQKQEKIVPFLKLKYQIKKASGDAFRECFIDNAFVCILKKIFAVISSQTGSTKLNVVSSVPYFYGATQIQNYKALLLQSGFNPLQIIYDHSASILSLHLDNQQKDSMKQILCIDFGTFSSKFTVIRMYNGLITSRDDEHNYYNESTEICGTKLDEIMLKWLIKNFESQNKGCYLEMENAKSRLKLLNEITRIKQVLSSGSNEVNFDIESLYEGIDYHFKLSKPKFESIIYDVFSATKDWVQTQLKQYQSQHASHCHIDYVIVSGGLAEIPRVQQILLEIFGDKLMTKHLNEKGISSNFINVYGCAIQAASLSYLHQFQNQIRGGHAALHSIIDLERPKTESSRSAAKDKSANASQQKQGQAEKNAFLHKLAKNKVALNAKRMNVHYILAQQRKQFCCIEKNAILPFEQSYSIGDDEVKAVLNESDGALEDITFTVDIVDDDCKTVAQTLEQTVNAKAAQKKGKGITMNVSMDSNELNIAVGSEKVTFEIENDEESEDEEDEEEDDENEATTDINKTDNTQPDNDNVVDID
mmetsp:Transcript_14315/g.22367  ORF Transcript_14315/g.22367 Transcript_14315/m.22367 type:complete len:750 (+) Transcript_14315:29-2278(+)